MGLRAMATALLASACLMPLLHLGGLLTAGMREIVLICALVAVMTGITTGWMSLRTGRTIQRLTRSKARFEQLSRLDPLTGLLNRRSFSEALSRAPVGTSLVMIDVDHFKAINDTHGHGIGDDVICRVAGMITEVMGTQVPSARLGGEEFGVLLWGAEVEARIALVEALRARIERERFRGIEGWFGITISAGISEYVPEKEPALVYAAADKALYLAKASGRNRVVHGAAGLSIILDLVAAGMELADDVELSDSRGVA